MRDLLDFLDKYFDKLLLTFIFIGMVLIVVHLIHDAERASAAAGLPMTSTDFVNWAETQSGTVLGALLTLITGVVVKSMLSSKDKSE